MSRSTRQPDSDYADVQIIGIPRALLYWRYGVMWQTFFEALGRSIVISEESTRATLETGDALSIDECCLASKLYMGHVQSLIGKCDALFIPSMANLGRFQTFCTKFQSLPDLVSNIFANQQVRVVSCVVNATDEKTEEREAYIELGQRFGASKKQAKAAYKTAVKAQEEADAAAAEGQKQRLLDSRAAAAQASEEAEEEAPLRIVVAAHPYVLYDSYIGEPLVNMLDELGVCTLFTDRYDKKKAYKESYNFSETMPWRVNREITGAILSMYDNIDGIVLISAFPCGPDSMTNDALIRYIKGKPILSLTIDAQSGTAGLETRLESFVDILRYQQRGGYFHASEH